MEPTNQTGTREEFSAFYLKNERLLYSFAAKKLITTEDQEDCIQTVIASIIRRLDVFLSYSEAVRIAYCKRAIANEAIDILKKKNRIKTCEIENATITVPDVEAAFLQQEQSRVIVQLLNQLRPEYSKIIELRYLFGYSADEISEITHFSKSTVLTYLSRGKAELRILLSQHYEK